MKKKAIIVVVVLFISVTLLSTFTMFIGEKQEPTPQPTKTALIRPVLATPSPDLDDPSVIYNEAQIDYLKEYQAQRSACDTDGSAFFITIQNGQQDTALMSDETFVTQLLEELTAFEEYCAHFGNEDVPEGLEAIQENLEKANESYSLFAEHFRAGLQELDQVEIDKSDEYLQAGNEYIQLANQALQ